MRLHVVCHVDPYTGYGRMNTSLIQGLSRNYDVSVTPTGGIDHHKLPAEIATKLTKQADVPQLLIHVPGYATSSQRHIRLSMWESSHITNSAVHNLNAAEAVVVVNEMNAIAFSSAGVTKPIVKVPLFLDEQWLISGNETNYPSGDFVFGFAGKNWHNADRKGFAILFELFTKFHSKYPNSKLKIKTDSASSLPYTGCPGIEICREELNQEELVGWMQGIHVFLNCSHSGGWEFFPQQALSQGRLLITSSFGGVGEYANTSNSLIVPHTYSQAISPHAGIWGTIEHNAAFKAMEQAMYGFYLKDLRQLRHKAVADMKVYTLENTVQALSNVINEHQIHF